MTLDVISNVDTQVACNQSTFDFSNRLLIFKLNESRTLRKDKKVGIGTYRKNRLSYYADFNNSQYFVYSAKGMW